MLDAILLIVLLCVVSAALYAFGAWGHYAGFVSGRVGMTPESQLVEARANGVRMFACFSVGQLVALAIAVWVSSRVLGSSTQLIRGAAGICLLVLANIAVFFAMYR
jgi:hypothetical protein